MFSREKILLFVALLIGVECYPALNLQLSKDDIGDGISIEVSGKTETKIKLRPSKQRNHEDSKSIKEVDGIISIIEVKPSNTERRQESNEKSGEYGGIVGETGSDIHEIRRNDKEKTDGKDNISAESGDSSQSAES